MNMDLLPLFWLLLVTMNSSKCLNVRPSRIITGDRLLWNSPEVNRTMDLRQEYSAVSTCRAFSFSTCSWKTRMWSMKATTRSADMGDACRPAAANRGATWRGMEHWAALRTKSSLQDMRNSATYDTGSMEWLMKCFCAIMDFTHLLYIQFARLKCLLFEVQEVLDPISSHHCDMWQAVTQQSKSTSILNANRPQMFGSSIYPNPHQSRWQSGHIMYMEFVNRQDRSAVRAQTLPIKWLLEEAFMQPAHGTKVCLSKSPVQERTRVMKGLLLVLRS